jgi:tetratricopeptide (TPR) repeat protein
VGIGSHAEALNWIDGELANITAAVGACPAAEGLPEVALILTVAASVVVSNYRGAADAVILCRDMVAVADRYRDRAVAARANEALGTALVKAGQAVRARRALLRARDLRRGDPAEEAGPLALLALVASNLGDLDAAERYADEAVEIGTRAGQWANVAVALIQKALVREAAGDRDIALDTMRRAAATAADVGHGYAQAMAIAAAASILRRAGLHDAAIRAHGEALELDDAHGLTDTAVHADRLWGMAQSCYAAREPQRARRLWDRAADILLRRDVIGPKDYDTILATTPPPPLQDVDRRDAARR